MMPRTDSERAPAGGETTKDSKDSKDSKGSKDSKEPEESPDSKELAEIKAKLMYQMVEDIPKRAPTMKLLFLRDAQADLIASSETSMQAMLNAFGVRRPSLVIELMHSWGFRDSLKLHNEEYYAKTPWMAGAVGGKAPFVPLPERESFAVDRSSESIAEERLDIFMNDVLLPLAEKTNAIVLCCACPDDCILSASFTRMFAVQKARWANSRPPFTVLSTFNSVEQFYRNEEKDPYWKEVRSQRTMHAHDAPSCTDA